MPVLDLSFECGESSLSVTRFTVHEGISTPFTISVWARSENPAIDLGAIVGQPAGFRVISGYVNVLNAGARLWTGICNYIEQVQSEITPRGTTLSTYFLRIVPNVWLLTQRRNYRIFQHLSIPDIVDKLLADWGTKPDWKIDRGKYPKLEYKVQYGETDYAFLCRLLEEAGIAYSFPDNDQEGSKLTLSDAIQSGATRPGPPIHYVDNPSEAAEREFVTRVRLVHEVRPGAHTIRDHDFRNPAYPLFGESPKKAPEDRYEQYHYMPGSFLVETGKGGDTPVADDKGIARYDQPYGLGRADRALAAERTGKALVVFDTNTIDLWPGVLFSMDNHSHAELAAGKRLLVTEFTVEGSPEAEWSMSGQAVFADEPYRPPIMTPRPYVRSVQTAVVVGPAGQEIHTDEFGRVRVQFPWDREGKNDDFSSCWIRVSQGWGGRGYGMLILPRIGQEVLVAFIEGDPDQPMIVGRFYNATHPVPYKLPDYKTVSTWKSESSMGGAGYNEIKFDDYKGEEMFYEQAEKNLRKLVKNDETMTTLRNRDKTVLGDELETVGVMRVEVTGIDRQEMTGANRTTIIGGNKFQLIRKDESEVTDANRLLLVGKDTDIVIKGEKRELNEWDTHQRVVGNRNEQIDQNQSLTVLESQFEKVGENHAQETGKELHHHAGDDWVGQGGQSVTLKGAGGFINIDAAGVTISGSMVYINDRGSPGNGKGSKPKEPVDAKPALVRVGRQWMAGATKAQEDSDWLLSLVGKNLDPDALNPLKAMELVVLARGADISTPHNGAIFWSGGIEAAGMAGQQLAKQQTADGIPSKTLEMTQGGQDLMAASKGANWNTQKAAWETVSQRLAEQASGDIKVVVRLPVKETAILRQEMKALAANKKVGKIEFFAVQTEADGVTPMKTAQGDFIMRPISAKEALAKPKP
jgi:type VI secretion system secreted protein VgrG